MPGYCFGARAATPLGFFAKPHGKIWNSIGLVLILLAAPPPILPANLPLTAVKRAKLQKLSKSHFKVKVVIFTFFRCKISPIHCQFTKRFESSLKSFLTFENYELQNCRRHLPT